MKRIIILAAVIATVTTGVALATTGAGVVSKEFGRTTVDNLSIHDTSPTDVVVVRNTFDPGGYTGWHSHPGIVSILVKKGQITLTLGNCSSKTYHQGDVFLERPSNIQNGVNTGTKPTIVIATFFSVPVGGSVRIDQPDPGCPAQTVQPTRPVSR